MKISFFSNFLSHHQLPFCKELIGTENVEFYFVATEKISDERISLGYEDLNAKFDFVIKTYLGQDEINKAKTLADKSDVVIVGSAPMFYFKERLKRKKLTFRYTERVFKDSKISVNLLKTILSTIKANRYGKMSLLAASAYAAGDYAKIGLFKNRVYRWGYFPEMNYYENVDSVIEKKKKNSIIWVARFIDWKHPELVIDLAKRLKNDGVDFEINMLGNGKLLSEITRQIEENDLLDCVHVLGAKPSGQIRSYMETAAIHIFTSDRNEGWGAVLNESMNSACAVVANSHIGSVPFLIENGVNGYTYQSFDELYKNVKRLLCEEELRKKIGKCAYETICNEWNHDVAAKRMVILCQTLLESGSTDNLWESGPCSKAKIM